MTTALRHLTAHLLGPHLEGYVAGDPDSIPPRTLSAVRDAGWRVARAALGMPGEDIVLATFDGEPGPVVVDPEDRTSNNAIMLLAGACAVGELVEAFIDDPSETRHVMSDHGWGELLERVSPDADLPATEAAALALAREHWEPLVVLARAVLDAPDQSLAWEQIVEMLGDDVAGAGYAPATVFDEAWADLLAGRVEPLTAGWDAHLPQA